MTLFYVWCEQNQYETSRQKKEIVARTMEDALTDFRDQYKGVNPVAVEKVFYIGEW